MNEGESNGSEVGGGKSGDAELPVRPCLIESRLHPERVLLTGAGAGTEVARQEGRVGLKGVGQSHPVTSEGKKARQRQVRVKVRNVAIGVEGGRTGVKCDRHSFCPVSSLRSHVDARKTNLQKDPKIT